MNQLRRYSDEIHPKLATRANGERGSRWRSAEERCVDSWLISGEDGVWKRAHRTPRRGLFTPHRVSAGPGRDTKLSTRRINIGTYVGTGAEFTITDDYSDPNAAHKILANAWVGTTEFEVEDIEQNIAKNINEDVGEKKAGKLLSLASSERRSVVAPASGTPERAVRCMSVSPGELKSCVSRSEMYALTGDPYKALPFFRSRILGYHRTNLSPVISMHEISSESQIAGEGECESCTEIPRQNHWCQTGTQATYGREQVDLGDTDYQSTNRQIPVGFGSRRNAGQNDCCPAARILALVRRIP